MEKHGTCFALSFGHFRTAAACGKDTIVKNLVSVTALALAASGPACAYQTGSLTCEKIGELAAQTLVAKQSGLTYATLYSELMDPLPGDGVERKLVGSIVEIIYHNDLIVAMKPSDAQVVFMHDCMRGKGKSD
jgi:hypothetical protein